MPSAAAVAPLATTYEPKSSPNPKGVTHARFEDSRHHWIGPRGRLNEHVGTATKKLWFGGRLKLTDQHIDDILDLDPKVCAGLTEFEFVYNDVRYEAHNDALGLSNAGVTKLALYCPKLKKVYLSGTSGLGDEALLSLLEYCPALNDLELTSASKCDNDFSDDVFETILQHRDWARKLKTLRISDSIFDKPMKKLSKKRKTVRIELVVTKEENKWGDWVLEEYFKTYNAGEKVRNVRRAA